MPDAPETIRAVLPAPRTLWAGPVRVSVRPWPGSSTRANLTFAAGHGDAVALPPADEMVRWVSSIRAMGYRSVRTGAVGPHVTQQLLALGFTVIQDLVLLSADLEQAASLHPGSQGAVRPRRIRVLGRRTTGRIIEVDRAAFPEGWSLDAGALHEARGATAHHGVWMVRDRRNPVGFVLAGADGATGYVQRLAVEPRAQGLGTGALLLDRAHAWMDSRGCSTAYVNTEPHNERALSLYRRFGYSALPYRLSVLEMDLHAEIRP
jgi:ribosomal protein S18 acetylase RimI-like enzyme